MKTTELNIQEALFEYCLRIGDTSLISGQRLSEWCGHAPILEEDIALSNISLDLIGQARIMLTYACKLEGQGRTEDTLAYHRDERQFRNLLITEQPNGDFAMSIAKQFFISVYNFHLYDQLSNSKDETIAAFAAKSLKEVAYHVRHSSDWMLRLGDGTTESRERLTEAVNELWYFVDDMFQADQVDELLHKLGLGASLSEVKKNWFEFVTDNFKKTGLTIPVINNSLRMGSRAGYHTEHLGYILAEMQFLPRAYPDAQW